MKKFRILGCQFSVILIMELTFRDLKSARVNPKNEINFKEFSLTICVKV